jgi:hypothetical protein
MTFLRGHDTQVALRKTAKTRVTVSLAETFSGYSPTVNALYLLQVLNSDLLTQPLVQVYLLATKLKAIAYRTGRLGKHLVQISLKFHSSPVKSEDRFDERRQPHFSPPGTLIDYIVTLQQFYRKRLCIVLVNFVRRY